MTKKNFFSFLCIAILIIISGCSDDYKYQPGKDTIEIFGNGKFQILSGANKNNFTNVETQEDIELIVYKYKEIKPLVYVIGESGYTILNYETEEIRKYTHLDDIPPEDKQIFKKLAKK